MALPRIESHRSPPPVTRMSQARLGHFNYSHGYMLSCNNLCHSRSDIHPYHSWSWLLRPRSSASWQLRSGEKFERRPLGSVVPSHQGRGACLERLQPVFRAALHLSNARCVPRVGASRSIKNRDDVSRASTVCGDKPHGCVPFCRPNEHSDYRRHRLAGPDLLRSCTQ